jgi:hypothetical protein
VPRLRRVVYSDGRRNSPVAQAPEQPDQLAPLGLRHGDEVRWRRNEGEMWKTARVLGVNKDGSLALTEFHTGRTRAIPIACCEVSFRGPKGGKRWKPVT